MSINFPHSADNEHDNEAGECGQKVGIAHVMSALLVVRPPKRRLRQFPSRSSASEEGEPI